MTSVSWGLWRRGRIRVRFVLGDDRGEELADVRLSGWPRSERHTRAEDPDGLRWDVTHVQIRRPEAYRKGPDPPDRLVVTRDKREVARVVDGVLHLAGREFWWGVHQDMSRVGSVKNERGRVVFRTSPGAGRHEPWAIFEVDSDLPDPFAVAMLSSAVLLRATGEAAGLGDVGGNVTT